MAQHYRSSHWNSDSICGVNMVGQRTPQDMDASIADCIACRAILEDRPLYGLSVVDEDGYSQTLLFNTAKEQIDNIKECYDNGALTVTLKILSVDDLKDGEW